MHRLIGLLILGILGLLGIFLILGFVVQSRERTAQARTLDHLRELHFGLSHWQHGPPRPGIESPIEPTLPPGTIPNPTLAVEQRLSWCVQILPALDQRKVDHGKIVASIRRDQAWDAPENIAPGRKRITTFLSPIAPPNPEPTAAAPTQFVGLAGIGEGVAARSGDEVNAVRGAFRFDEPTALSDFLDGVDNTLIVGDTNTALGPWIQGGRSTVRDVPADLAVYLGPGKPFGGCRPDGGYFLYAGGQGTFLKAAIDPRIFRALTTIRGGGSELRVGEDEQ